jgi:uncharacterized protein YegL
MPAWTVCVQRRFSEAKLLSLRSINEAKPKTSESASFRLNEVKRFTEGKLRSFANIGRRAGSFFIVFLTMLTSMMLLMSESSFCSDDPLELLFERFPPQQARADFVIVLDTSGSMREGGLFEQVVQAVATFIEALSPEDYLSILAFDSHVRYLVIPQEIGKNKRALQQRILSLPEPSGQKTDIGAALEKTVDELNRPNANPLQFVVFITDGRHDPPQESEYPTALHENFSLLKEKAKRTLFDHVIAVTGLGLNRSTDIELLRKVFEDAMPLTVDKTGLANFFSRLKAEIKIRKLRLQVIQELKRGGISIVLLEEGKKRIKAGGKTSIRFKLKSNYEHLDTAVFIEEMEIPSDEHFQCEIAEGVRSVNIPSKGESPAITLILQDTQRNRWFSLRKVQTSKVTIRCHLLINLLPEAGLLKLNIEPKVKQVL